MLRTQQGDGADLTLFALDRTEENRCGDTHATVQQPVGIHAEIEVGLGEERISGLPEYQNRISADSSDMLLRCEQVGDGSEISPEKSEGSTFFLNQSDLTFRSVEDDPFIFEN